MIYNFKHNGMVLDIVVTDTNDVYLQNLCLEKNRSDSFDGLPHPCFVNVTGQNRGGMHGSSHSGATSSFTLKYKSHTSYQNEKGLAVELVMCDEAMTVTVHYQLCSNAKAVRSYAVVQNTGSGELGLEYVSSLSTHLAPLAENSCNDNISVLVPYNVWRQEANWKSYRLSQIGMEKYSNGATKRFSIGNVGHWSTKSYLPMGGVINEQSGEAFLWQVENNGSWLWELTDIGGRLLLNISGPEEQEAGWYKCLKAGESFETVPCAITFGDSFDDCIGEMTLYRRMIIDDKGVDKYNPVIFNDFMRCLVVDPTSEKMYPVIDKAAELGCEYYVTDAGWYSTPEVGWWNGVGEWIENRERFPEGIKAVFDYIKSKGMKPGIWLEIEVMSINSPALKYFDDDCFIMRHGKRVIDSRRYHLDFRNPKVIKYVNEVVDRVVNEYGAEYIKFDHNIEPGIGTEVNADSFGDGLLGHCRAVVRWREDIRKKYPNLIIENCSSGGMRMDYASLKSCQLQSVSDQEEYFNNAILASIIPTAVLPEQCAMWCPPIAEESENEVIMSMVSALMLRIYQAGQVTQLNSVCFDRLKEGIALYKKIRSDISKAIPFYPWGITKFGDKYFCTGYKCEDKKYLCVWHLDGDDDEKFIPIDMAGRAEILYPSGCSYARLEEACGGINVTLPKNTAILVQINR